MIVIVRINVLFPRRQGKDFVPFLLGGISTSLLVMVNVCKTKEDIKGKFPLVGIGNSVSGIKSKLSVGIGSE